MIQALVPGARAAAVDGETLTLFLGRSECKPATWVLCIGLQWINHDLPLVQPLTNAPPRPGEGRKSLIQQPASILGVGGSAAVLECTVQQCAPRNNAAFRQDVQRWLQFHWESRVSGACFCSGSVQSER